MQGKGKAVPCLIPDHTMNMYRAVQLQLCTFLPLALDEGEWSASHPGHFTSGERASI